MPKNGDERREIMRWLLWDNHKLTSYTATLRFMRALAKDPDPAVVAEFHRRAEAAWRVLDAHLADAHLRRRRPPDRRRSVVVRISVLAGGDRRRLE